MPITEIKANLTHLPTFFLFSNTKAAHFSPYPKLCRQSRNFQSRESFIRFPNFGLFHPLSNYVPSTCRDLQNALPHISPLFPKYHISSCTFFPLALVSSVFSYYDTQHEVSVRPIYYFAASTLLFPPWISLSLMPAP